jgi:hypothetical protein
MQRTIEIGTSAAAPAALELGPAQLLPARRDGKTRSSKRRATCRRPRLRAVRDADCIAWAGSSPPYHALRLIEGRIDRAGAEHTTATRSSRAARLSGSTASRSPHLRLWGMKTTVCRAGRPRGCPGPAADAAPAARHVLGQRTGLPANARAYGKAQRNRKALSAADACPRSQ